MPGRLGDRLKAFVWLFVKMQWLASGCGDHRRSSESHAHPTRGTYLPLAPKQFCHSHRPAYKDHWFGTVDCGLPTEILRPAIVYRPEKRTVAIASTEIGIHILSTSPNCMVM